ncbi:MAG: exo-alpha-sialidase [Chloroflexi bacterium]|nr:exo-alpha-sialidase [Chloroflexota bacterium]
MQPIELLGSEVAYRNPKPYLRSLQARHPSLVVFDDGELVLGFDVGQSDESLDYATHRARSKDGGRTWREEGPLLAPTSRPPTTNSLRLSLAGGEVVAFGNIHHRERQDEGLVNRATLGFVSTDLVLLRSRDRGRSWSAPESIVPPLESPAWETCHHVIELRNGRWLAPTATWRGWDGEHPAGEQTVVLISDDRGRTWPRFGRVFDGRQSGLVHWEVSVVQLHDGRVLAVAWVHDPRTRADHPNEFAISSDGGQAFGEPDSTGLQGQTCKMLHLRDGRVLSFYRRLDRPGLWANLASVDHGRWQNLAELPVWQLGEGATVEPAQTSADQLAALRFGYPTPLQLPDGQVLVVFWCVEACQSVIRLARLRITK